MGLCLLLVGGMGLGLVLVVWGFALSSQKPSIRATRQMSCHHDDFRRVLTRASDEYLHQVIQIIQHDRR